MTNSVKGVIVLEGPDGAGKTTLAEHLVKKYGGVYVHRTWSPEMNVWDHHTEALKIAHEKSYQELVVIDRLWPSEYIYGRVFRGSSQYPAWAARSMDRVLLRLCAQTICCIPKDVDYVVKMHAEKKKRNEEMFPSVREVATRYLDWWTGSVIRPIDGDYVEQLTALGGVSTRQDYTYYDVNVNGSRMHEFAELAVDVMIERQKKQFSLALNPALQNFIGYLPTARYLFVGEELGEPEGWCRWPFYSPAGSPDFLNRTLHRVAFDETTGCWTNAINSDDQLSRIVFEKNSLLVICLGGIARRRCNSIGINIHAVIHHPQWARRFNFHGSNATPYHEELLDALSTSPKRGSRLDGTIRKDPTKRGTGSPEEAANPRDPRSADEVRHEVSGSHDTGT